MSFFTLTFTSGAPLIDVVINITTERSAALRTANQAIPNPVQIRALIDTGASCTVIDVNVVKELGLSPTGQTPVHTPSTANQKPHEANQYDVIVTIPSGRSTPFISQVLPVIEAELEHQGFKALIGRDILSNCFLMVEGPRQIFTLGF